jgi:hypothetical protein
MLSELYELMQMSQAYAAFAERHNICSPSILTVAEDETAELLCERLAPRISGKTVVETGGRIGLLSLAMRRLPSASTASRPIRCGRLRGDADHVRDEAEEHELYSASPTNSSAAFAAASRYRVRPGMSPL